MNEYLSSSGIYYTTREPVDTESARFEYAMMRLRLHEGFLLSDYERRFGESFLFGREKKIAELKSAGYIDWDGDRIALTERGFYVSNSILTELL
jgi:oxygen-independent coproporphyrinogen-3 oxidase